jgi:hypothetical protein
MPIRAASLALLIALWFAFSTSASPGELSAAAAVTLLAAGCYLAVRRTTEVPAGLRLRWIGKALRTWPGKVVSDTSIVLRAAVTRRPPEGQIRRVRVGEGTQIEVAWAMVGTSISPNAYVVGWDDTTRELVIHELVPRGEAKEALWWPD